MPSLPCVGLRCGTWSRHRLLLFLELGRPYTMLAALLVGVFLGLAAGAGPRSLLLGLSLAAAQGFGQAVNQITDLEIDRINKPYRPLPSGRLTVERAWDYALIYYIAGALASSLLGPRGLASYLVLAGFAFFYSVPPVRAKEQGAWASLAWQALSRGLLPPLLASWIFQADALPLAILAFLWVLALQPTKDFGDIEGDRAYGVETLPVRYGVRGARAIMALLTLVFLAALIGLHRLGMVPALMLLEVPVALAALYGVGVSSPTENNIGWNAYYAGLALLYLLWLAGRG